MFEVDENYTYSVYVYDLPMSQEIVDEILELIRTKFNVNINYEFKNKEDAQKCCDYLNEVYLPMLKLMGE